MTLLLTGSGQGLCVWRALNGCEHLPRVTSASQPWDLRAMRQFHLTLPPRNLGLLCIIFLHVLKTRKSKNTEKDSSESPCFSPGKSRVRPKCISNSRLKKYWPVCTEQLGQDPFCLEATHCTALPLPRHVS